MPSICGGPAASPSSSIASPRDACHGRYTGAEALVVEVAAVPYRLDYMQLKDIGDVIQIENTSFSMTWPANSYRRELQENRMARYLVVRYEPGPGEEPPQIEAPRRPFPFLLWPRSSRRSEQAARSAVVGYAGMWLMVDEAHITSIAVRPPYRRRGLAELMMLGVVDVARRMNARFFTLEVRVSNLAAQQLYEKFGFYRTGRRVRYYSDNHEDALVMWSEQIDSPSFQQRCQLISAELRDRLSWTSNL